MDACVIAPSEAINDNIIEDPDSMITISKALVPGRKSIQILRYTPGAIWLIRL